MKCLLLIAAFVVATATAQAAYLEEPEEATPPPRTVAPPQHPLPDNPLTEVLRRITVHGGYTYKGLTVFPLTVAEVTDATDYLSLSEALREGVLVITEKGGGRVGAVVAENTGGRFVLLIAGEVLAGGKQNRTLRADVLLPPHSGKVELPVFCVERRRWSGRGMSFERTPATAVVNVRAAAQAGRSQEAVWGAVGYYQRGLEIVSGTENLEAVTNSPEVRRAIADYQSAFAKHLPENAVGMVVASHWRIVGADVFCNPGVFRKHRDRLLESYGVHCHMQRKQQERTKRGRIAPMRIGRREAERFLRRVLEAEHTWAPTPGAGRLLRVQGAGMNGMALVRRRAVVHAGLLAQRHIVPLPAPGPIPMPVPRRESEE